MKWYKFVIYFQLFLAALVNLGGAGMYLTGSHYNGQAYAVYGVFPALKTIDILMGIVSLLLAVSSIIIRQKLAHYKTEGPSWYLIMLGVSAVSTLVYVVLASIITGINVLDTSTIASIATNIVMIFANKVYFDKRMSLFTN